MADREINHQVSTIEKHESSAPANAEKRGATENFQQEAHKLMKDNESKPHSRSEMVAHERNSNEDKPQQTGADAKAILDGFSISGTDKPTAIQPDPKVDHKDSKGANHHQDQKDRHEPSIGIPNWMLNFMN